jgi:glucokinase
VNSFGSETGHIIVDCRPDARLCVWGGGQGHLEAYASASAVAAIAGERLQAGAKSSLKQVWEGKGRVSARALYEAAREGDAFALEIIDETAFYLGIGITTTVHSVDPGLVVLGGAMDFGGRGCPVGQRFLQGIVDEFERRTFPNVFAGTKIDFANLGGDAGYIGAAGIARQAYQDSARSAELASH